ncbi:MAG TPA: hypothetical protein DER41_08355 [Firmicutes bacterium]|nr:hypothetical protein [Bacillota bacterium]HCF89954.1 hypothetical protein [Bacillota bacterium]
MAQRSNKQKYPAEVIGGFFIYAAGRHWCMEACGMGSWQHAVWGPVYKNWWGFAAGKPNSISNLVNRVM